MIGKKCVCTGRGIVGKVLFGVVSIRCTKFVDWDGMYL